MAGSYINKLVVMVVAPVIIIGAMAAAVRGGKLHPHHFRRNSLLLLFILYPNVCTAIMGAFDCLQLADGSALLAADLSVVCDNTYRIAMYPIAGGLFVFYALGIFPPALSRACKWRAQNSSLQIKWCERFSLVRLLSRIVVRRIPRVVWLATLPPSRSAALARAEAPAWLPIRGVHPEAVVVRDRRADPQTAALVKTPACHLYLLPTHVHHLYRLPSPAVES